MNILFVFNQFPGLGGVETVSDNLISYLGDYFKIFTVSLYSDSSMPLNDKVEKAFLLPEDDSRKAEFYNSLVKDLEISCVINQGIYPVLHPVVFNSDRERSVKVISVLHGMPGYEKLMFWQKKSIRRSPRWLNMLRRQWCAKGKYPRYYKFIRPFAESYRTAAIEGDMVVLLTSGYERQFIREYGLEQYASKICSIENPLPSGFSMYGEPDWSEKKDMILFVGRLSIEKRVWIVLDMWRKVGKKVGWTLFVVGDGYGNCSHLNSLGQFLQGFGGHSGRNSLRHILRQKVPHPAGIAALSGFSELHLAQQGVPFRLLLQLH